MKLSAINHSQAENKRYNVILGSLGINVIACMLGLLDSLLNIKSNAFGEQSAKAPATSLPFDAPTVAGTFSLFEDENENVTDDYSAIQALKHGLINSMLKVVRTGFAELRSEILAFARMTGKKEWSGMAGNKSNVILSPLWASGSVVRRSMVRIVKVACGSKDSDGAFAFSAQPLRMTGNKGLVNVVICNGGVIC